MNKELEEAKKQLRKTRKWVTFFVGLLAVLLFAIIMLVTWAVVEEQKSPTNFAECVLDKDAKLLESYPEQCVVDGKSFTNPGQVVAEPILDFIAMSNFDEASERFKEYAQRTTGQISGDKPCLTMYFQKESGDFVYVSEGRGILGLDNNGNPECQFGGGSYAAYYKFDGSDYTLVLTTQDTVTCDKVEGIPVEIIQSCTDENGNTVWR